MSNILKFSVEARFKESLSTPAKSEIIKSLVGFLLSWEIISDVEELVILIGGREVLIKTILGEEDE